MLGDIARVALAVGQDLYPEHKLSDLDINAATEGGDACPHERLAFLALVWPRLSNALRIIENTPSAALMPAVREARIEQGCLKRVSPNAVLAAIRSGDFIPAPDSAGSVAQRLQGRLPRRIAETIPVPASDTLINRSVKAILTQIVRDLRNIAALAEAAEAPDVMRQAQELRETVCRHIRREPWHHLPPAPVVNVIPTAFSPAVRYFFDQWRQYRRAFAFDWTNPLFLLPARETWLLYEYSCLFSVARALRDIGFRTMSADGFALSRSGLTFSLKKGRESRLVFRGEGGPRVVLSYNPSFPGRETGPVSSWHSRSHSLRPDITLEVEGRLLVFDAKFKTYAEASINEEDETIWRFRDGSLLPDLQQMHTYRDAIVRREQENVVSEAWLLYAGRRGVTNPEVVAYPHASQAHPFGAGKVGAILLRPGLDPEPLRDFVHWFCIRRTG
jgi:hypothetical protein